MMEIVAAIKTVTVGIAAVGFVVGGTLYIEDAHDALADEHDSLVPHSEFDGHLAEQRVRTIFGYMDQIRALGPEQWLCDAMSQELIVLCTDVPEHAMCKDRSSILEQVGC